MFLGWQGVYVFTVCDVPNERGRIRALGHIMLPVLVQEVAASLPGHGQLFGFAHGNHACVAPSFPGPGEALVQRPLLPHLLLCLLDGLHRQRRAVVLHLR